MHTRRQTRCILLPSFCPNVDMAFMNFLQVEDLCFDKAWKSDILVLSKNIDVNDSKTHNKITKKICYV